MLKRTSMIVGAMFLALPMWIWIQKIAIPHQQAESTALDSPREISRIYIRAGWAPGSCCCTIAIPMVTRSLARFRSGYYGRVLDPSRPDDPKDQQAFAYPVYVVLLLAPTVELPFPDGARESLFWLFAALTARFRAAMVARAGVANFRDARLSGFF